MQFLATLWRPVRWLVAIATSLLLIACSGGSGGGGDSSSSSPSGDGFTISATSLSFSAQQNSPLPPSQNIQASFTHPEAVYLGAAYPPGVAPATWLSVQLTGSGNSRTFVFSVNTTSLSPGTYTTTIGLGIARADGSIITYKNVNITYTVKPKLTVSPAFLNFVFVIGGSAPASLGLNIGSTGATWTASANQPWVTLNSISGTAPGLINVGVTTNLTPGIYNATIEISDGETLLSIPIIYTVRAPTIAVSPSQLTLSAINGNPSPPPANITVSSETGIPISYTTSVIYSSGVSGWLTVPANGTVPGTLGIGYSTNVAPGSHTADVVLTPLNGAPAVTLRVNYTATASSLTLNPTAVTFSLDANSTTADSDLKRTVIVSQTGSVLNWTATSSAPWLTVSPASGANVVAVTLTIVPAQLDALENGQHTATVTFTANGPYVTNQTKFLPITLNLNIPRINWVAPYIAYTNTSKQVIIRGSGFSTISNQRVLFGATPASSISVISDTEIHIANPVLASGNHLVKVENQLGLTRSRASLVVVEPSQLGYTTLPTSGYPNRIIHDAERKSIYVDRWGDGMDRIERHRHTPTGWMTDSLLIPGIMDIGLAPDGKEIIAISTDKLLHVDPASLSITRTVALSTILSNPSIYDQFYRLGIANDGNVMVFIGAGWTWPYRYNLLTKSYTGIPIGSPYVDSPHTSASGDGSRIIVGQSGSGGLIYYYDASSGRFESTELNRSVVFISMDRHASRTRIDNLIFDRQFSLEGTITDFVSTYLGTISPDGSKAYYYTPGSLPGTPGTLRIYDLNNRNGTGGFNQIGSGINIPDNPGYAGNIMLSTTPDGGTLILTGDEKVIILPLP